VLGASDQSKVCLELPKDVFSVLAQSLVQNHLSAFIGIYRRMVEEATYSWSFAENVAESMKLLFDAQDTSAADKSQALRVAIIAAVRQNRFAAMNTCKLMITSIDEGELAQRVHDVLLQHDTHFIQNIEPTECQAGAIRAAIISLKAAATAAANSADTSGISLS